MQDRRRSRRRGAGRRSRRTFWRGSRRRRSGFRQVLLRSGRLAPVRAGSPGCPSTTRPVPSGRSWRTRAARSPGSSRTARRSSSSAAAPARRCACSCAAAHALRLRAGRHLGRVLGREAARLRRDFPRPERRSRSRPISPARSRCRPDLGRRPRGVLPGLHHRQLRAAGGRRASCATPRACSGRARR